jgi:hypothetical protein
MNRDAEKFVALKPVSVTPFNLLPSMLAEAGEEVQSAVNCYECDIRVSGSPTVPFSVAEKKMKETKGSNIFYWLKKLLRFYLSMMNQVKGSLVRLCGLGIKPNGFRPKNVRRSPLSTSNRVSSLWASVLSSRFKSRYGHSALVGSCKASEEPSSLEPLPEEGLGFDSVVGSVLGLLEVGSEMVVSFSSTPSASLTAQKPSMESLEASLVAGGIPSPLLGATPEPVLGGSYAPFGV